MKGVEKRRAVYMEQKTNYGFFRTVFQTFIHGIKRLLLRLWVSYCQNL